MAGEKRQDMRRELEALRKKARGVFGAGAEEPGASDEAPASGSRRDLRRTPGNGRAADGDRGPAAPAPRRRGPPGPLEALVPGDIHRTASGSLWRIRKCAETIWPRAGDIHREYIEVLASPGPAPAGRGVLEELKAVRSGDICYLDLETTGLRNSPLFLVGLMYSEGESLVIDQLFARDYTEERAVVELAGVLLSGFPMLVTFNGERFDVPFLAERTAYSGLPFARPRAHLDLLPVSRSILAGRTPNHRLQTLERFVLGRKRVGDIPGCDIPPAYHEFVRTGDAADMSAVIHHNRLDLLSMLELVTVYLGHAGETG